MTYILAVLLSLQTLFAQKALGTVTFKDGSILTGYLEIQGNHRIKFKTEKKETAKKYHFSKILKAQIFYENDTATYVYLPKKGKSNQRIYRELVTGKVSLYERSTSGNANHHYDVSPGFVGNRVIGNNSYTFQKYFIKRKKDDGVTKFWENTIYSKGFKKSVRDYLGDCKLLLEKVEKKEYKIENIIEAFEFYNYKCAKK